MATKTFEELKQLAIQIRDEKTNKQNTATRVGTEMLEHLNKLEQDYYDKTTINNRTSEYNVSLNHPTSGLSGSNKYDLSSAIAQVPAELRSNGLTVSFINSAGDTEKWEFGGGSWGTGSFSQVGTKRFTKLDNKIDNLESQKLNKSESPQKDTEEDGAFFTDELGNVFMQYLKDEGFDVAKISKSFLAKISSVISAVVDTEEDGAFLCNEKGEVFARFVNGKFEVVGLSGGGSSNVENLEDVKNVVGGSAGQFLQKQADGKWAGANVSFPQQSLNGLTDVNINPVEGSILQYKNGRWVNAEISIEGLVTTDSRANHPCYGKHFFSLGDSHTEGIQHGLWQKFCKITGAIYHTLLRKKVNDEYHFFSATTSSDSYTELIDEEDTGVVVNCDQFNWANYVHAAYTYAQKKGFNIDYIFVENCHFTKWNFYEEDGTLIENVPIVLLNPTKTYSKIFKDAMEVMNFMSKDENVSSVVDELGFDSIDSSFNLRYGSVSQELVFKLKDSTSLNMNATAKIYFGDNNPISTELKKGMSLTECVDAINQWSFQEFSEWENSNKGTTGNSTILLNYNYSSNKEMNIARLEIDEGCNLEMEEPEISSNLKDWIHEYGLKSTDGLKKQSSWLRSGGYVNWNKPNAMLGAMQYIGKYSPKTKFVFLGIWNNSMSEKYIYPDGSVNPYDLFKSDSYKSGQISKESIKNIAEIFGWQYIDVDKLSGITPFNVTPTFNSYNNVHMEDAGYTRSAEIIARYVK